MSSKSDGGKGSSPRPYSVSQQEYDSRWDAIFSRDNDVGRDTSRDKPKEKEDPPKEQPKEEPVK